MNVPVYCTAFYVRYVGSLQKVCGVTVDLAGVRCEKILALDQRFSNFFQVGTTFISQNVLRTTLLLGLSNSLGLP